MRHLSVDPKKHSFKKCKRNLLTITLPVTYADISEAYWTIGGMRK